MERDMDHKTKEDVLADWIIDQNTTRFQELLKQETDEGRYKILANLLACEFGGTKDASSA
jgi:hypothetical protein